jgi:hypothetical protein
MNNMKNNLISGAIFGIATLVIVVIGFTIIKPTVVVNAVNNVLGATSGPDHYNLEQFLGGFLKGNYYATTTGAAVILKVSDVAGYDTISMKPIVSATTVTFFASSTASSWLPQAGMQQTTCFLNATTTAAETLIFVAGVGIDLQSATSTGQTGARDVTISPNGTACFTFIRKAATASAFDIEANLTEYEDAD